MKKSSGKCIREICLAVIVLIIGICFFERYHIFGGNLDWLDQHSVIPDYFRKLFCETGDIFPQFAPNIGGGQNIYNFAYYGLFNPIILISYALPFVKMDNYIMIGSIIGIGVGAILLYRWLLHNQFSKNLSFVLACMYIFAVPIIYHSYIHIMFVSYMPFMIMALYGVDRYFQDKKKGLYIAGVFLMIMTSFYFSIGGMLALVIYGMLVYFKNNKFKFKQFLIDGIRFVMPMFIAVLMSGVLLVPTFMALRNRTAVDAGMVIHWYDYILPTFSTKSILYTSYGVGLGTIVLVVLFAGIFYKKLHEKIYGISLILVLFIPLFNYLLNGGLYLKGKVFIPFIPLIIYWIGYYIQHINDSKKKIIDILPYIIMLAVVCINAKNYSGNHWMAILAEGVVLTIIYIVTKSPRIMLGFSMAALISVNVYSYATTDKIIDYKAYEHILDSDVEELIASIEDKGYRIEQHSDRSENLANINRIHSLSQDITSIYSSTYNQDYMNFRTKTYGIEQPYRNYMMQSVSYNPLFMDLMGIRYVVSNRYEKGMTALGTKGEYTIYENVDAVPLIYGTTKVMEGDQYEKLSFPYNQIALTQYAVIENESYDNSIVTGTENNTAVKAQAYIDKTMISIDSKWPTIDKEGIAIDDTETGYNIDIKDSYELKIPIEKAKKAGIVFVSCKIDNEKTSKDVAVSVGGIKNKLTASDHEYYNGNTEFKYTFYISNHQKYVNVKLSPGKYNISDIKIYYMPIKCINYKELVETRFADKTSANKNIYEGEIVADKEQYVITSIPYDDSFIVKVDGEKTDIIKVNTGFLGYKISEGNHKVSIEYEAAGFKLGMILSVIGFALMIVTIITTRYKKSN